MEITKEKIRETLAHNIGMLVKEVNDDSDFTNDLGMDSLDKVELIMNIETELGFGLIIPDNATENVNNLNDLYKALEELKVKVI